MEIFIPSQNRENLQEKFASILRNAVADFKIQMGYDDFAKIFKGPDSKTLYRANIFDPTQIEKLKARVKKINSVPHFESPLIPLTKKLIISAAYLLVLYFSSDIKAGIKTMEVNATAAVNGVTPSQQAAFNKAVENQYGSFENVIATVSPSIDNGLLDLKEQDLSDIEFTKKFLTDPNIGIYSIDKDRLTWLNRNLGMREGDITNATSGNNLLTQILKAMVNNKKITQEDMNRIMNSLPKLKEDPKFAKFVIRVVPLDIRAGEDKYLSVYK